MDRILSIRFICRRAGSFYTFRQEKLHTSPKLLNTNDSSSSDSSDSDTDTSEQPKNLLRRDEQSKKQTIDLLNNLLATMAKPQDVQKPMERAIPKKKPFPKKIPEPPIEDKLTVAAKKAAVAMGGDVEKTQAELLSKIFSAPKPKPPPIASDGPEPSKLSLSELLGEMKIDRSVAPEKSETTFSRSPRIQEAAEKFKNMRIDYKSRYQVRNLGKLETANLYGGKRLMIFNSSMECAEDTPKLETWDKLEEKELKLLLTHPPKNIFEEMIQWTEKGLLWKFPINNEIGMEAEESVHFSEHVFMERHLQGWCPRHGPIRHFMELVCVGLSMNHYIPVQEKIDHIMWYRDYFAEKQELLKEIGAITDEILVSDTKKQIEPK